VSVIGLSLQLVLNAGCSLRGSAAVLSTFVARGLADFAVPAVSTIRSWLLRLGYAALTRPLDRTQPWFWLVDHTMQVGAQKLLVILGGALSQVAFGTRPLALTDLHLVALVPMDHSDGDAVERELEVAALRTGVPRLIVSDQGGDLVKGTREYAAVRPHVAHVPDVAHFGANLLQRSWEAQPAWSSFIQKFQETATRLRSSRQAELMGPRLRPKGRFMNLEVQLRFVRMLLARLDGPDPDPRVAEHYGWVREYRPSVTAWLAEHHLVRQTIRHLRLHGLHAGTPAELNRLWKPLGLRGQAGLVSLARSWCGYVRHYRPRAAADRYVASTEVLESSFGKLKRLAQQQSDSGLTGLVLAIGTIVGSLGDEQVRAGLDATPQKAVDRWQETRLGRTVQWLRRRLMGTATR
jgi:hypothetical protein